MTFKNSEVYRVWQKNLERMRENSRGYLFEYRIWLILFIAAGLCDMASTIYFMVNDGVDRELHPAIRIVSWFLGPIFGPIFGKFCQFCAVVFITIYWRQWAKYIFLTGIILYFWASWYNIWGTNMYIPRFMHYIPSW